LSHHLVIFFAEINQSRTMSGEKDWDMPCCGCCQDPLLCIYTCCCPCFAYFEAAENIGSNNGFIYLLAVLLGFDCCTLGVMAEEVAQRAGIELGLMPAMLYACLDPCCCLSCRTVHQSRLIKAQGAPGGQAMDRK